MGVFVDWAASTPLAGGDILPITFLAGVQYPREHDDDGLTRRFDAWTDGQGRIVVPLPIRDPEPVGSWNSWSLAGAVHQAPQIAEL